MMHGIENLNLRAIKTERIESKMTLLDAVYNRRAARSYTSQEVEAKIVNKLIDAATQAPSAMNSQPWAFLVVRNSSILRELSDSAKSFLSKNIRWKAGTEHYAKLMVDTQFDIFYGAKTLIVICAERNGFGPSEDCYLAGENLMLAATALGLATCPIGFARDILGSKEYRKKFSIPERYLPVLPIIVGYPSSIPPKPEHRSPVILKWVD